MFDVQDSKSVTSYTATRGQIWGNSYIVVVMDINAISVLRQTIVGFSSCAVVKLEE